MTRTPYVEEWLAYADEDVRAAALMLAEGSLPNPICFHAQQAGEKALKGYLVSQDEKPERTHDLLNLLTACRGFDVSFDAVEGDTRYLQQFYTEARYPGDIPAFTMAQARKAYDAAKRIREFVEERLDAGTKEAAA